MFDFFIKISREIFLLLLWNLYRTYKKNVANKNLFWQLRKDHVLDWISPAFWKLYKRILQCLSSFKQSLYWKNIFFYSIKMISHSVNSEPFQLIELSSNSADSIFLQLPIFFYLEYNFQSDVFCPTPPTEIYTNKKIIHLVILS